MDNLLYDILRLKKDIFNPFEFEDLPEQYKEMFQPLINFYNSESKKELEFGLSVNNGIDIITLRNMMLEYSGAVAGNILNLVSGKKLDEEKLKRIYLIRYSIINLIIILEQIRQNILIKE